MFLNITINQWLGVIVAILAIIPTIILLSYYKKTLFIDYFLFGMFFLFATIVLFADPLAGLTNILIVYQIHHISIDTAYLLLFLHAVRMRWRRAPRILMFIGITWYLLLFLMTLTWQLMYQPQSAQVVFWYLPHTFSSYYPLGAGLKINGVIIYSTAFRYWGELYRLYSIGVLLYAYITVKPIIHSSKINLAKRLWILIWILLLIHAISLFPWFDFTNIVDIFLIGGGLILAFISIRMPEAILISESQLIRLKELYDKIDDYTMTTPDNQNYERDLLESPLLQESIRNYLEYVATTEDMSKYNVTPKKDKDKQTEQN